MYVAGELNGLSRRSLPYQGGGSVSFDRAAEYYDRTRLLPANLIPNLLPSLPRDGLCLEIGVGTGRIALPLVEAGIRVVGIDISTEMLKKLVAKRHGPSPYVAVADATRLPFPDRTFAAAVAAHVLHLIPDWRSAVSELVRVVRGEGVLIATRGGRAGQRWHGEVRRHFFEQAGDPSWPPGVDSIEELDDHMRSLGLDVEALPDLVTRDSMSVNQVVEILEAGYLSACWGIEEETRRRAAAATREWARERFGDLDLERDAVESMHWRAYRSGKQR
jgi:ubiquinone/menaquinone biosynthesis C-methylase UbiE